jgi:hypothetical protein
MHFDALDDGYGNYLDDRGWGAGDSCPVIPSLTSCKPTEALLMRPRVSRGWQRTPGVQMLC